MHRWDTTRDRLQPKRAAPHGFSKAPRLRLHTVFADLALAYLEHLLARHEHTDSATLSLHVLTIPMKGDGMTHEMQLVLCEVGGIGGVLHTGGSENKHMLASATTYE